MLAQAHGYPGGSPAGRSPVVLHLNASHGLAPPYDAVPGSSLVAITDWAHVTLSVRDHDRGVRWHEAVPCSSPAESGGEPAEYAQHREIGKS
jgi:hypothetical protein